jgi:hypothetical protein
MGRHGEESRKSFRNGEQGRGVGYPNIPKAEEIGRRVDGKTQPELGNGEIGGEAGSEHTLWRLCNMGWFAQARVLVSTGVVPECSTAQLDIGEPLMIATWLLHNLNQKSRSTGLRDTVRSAPFVLR